MACHIGYCFPEYKKQLQSITFGSPKVGNKEFSEFFNEIYPNAQRYNLFFLIFDLSQHYMNPLIW
jgi:hypothetical protein